MSWINKIATGIERAFDSARPNLKTVIPPLLLLCEVQSRPGLSAIALSSSIIRRLPEAGIETGTNPDGSANKINQFVRIISEEIVKEFKDNALITCAIQPYTINSVGTGASASGPVVVNSLNTIAMTIKGIMQ